MSMQKYIFSMNTFFTCMIWVPATFPLESSPTLLDRACCSASSISSNVSGKFPKIGKCPESKVKCYQIENINFNLVYFIMKTIKPREKSILPEMSIMIALSFLLNRILAEWKFLRQRIGFQRFLEPHEHCFY